METALSAVWRANLRCFRQSTKIRRAALDRKAEAAVPRDLLSGLRHFAHEGQQILFGVVEESHPQIVGGHSCDQVRRAFELHTLAEHLPVGTGDVGYSKVQN